jgi:hypothetical protein
VEPADPQSLERQVRQLLADKISGNQVGMWLLLPEHLRLGTWDLLCGWSQAAPETLEPRLALQLVHEAALCTCSRRQGRSLSQKCGVHPFAGAKVRVRRSLTLPWSRRCSCTGWSPLSGAVIKFILTASSISYPKIAISHQARSARIPRDARARPASN